MQDKKFKHKVFLSDNNIEVSTLSGLLKKRMRGFDELVEDYQHTLNEDQQVMEDNITQLDMEIEEDLYDEYEQWLENNEEAEEGVLLKKVIKKPRPKKPKSDESILEELWKINRREQLKRSFLKESGIKTPIKGWRVFIGKYKLERQTLFSYTYQLSKHDGE